MALDPQTTEQLLDLIEQIAGDPVVREERDLDLFEEDLFDSMAAIEFLVSLEVEFGVKIAPTELDREEMNTVNKIIEQVDKRI